MDPRTQQLARNLISYSSDLQPGESILIEVFDEALPLTKVLVEETYRVGGVPFLSLKNKQHQRALIAGSTIPQLQKIAQWESARMKEMQAYIGIRAGGNVSEMSDVPADKMQIYNQYWSKPVHSEIRVAKTKWCVLRYPNQSMAQLAGMSTDAFEDYYYRVCNLDYAKMDAAMDPLIELLAKTD